MSSMTGPPSLMSGNTVKKVTKMSSTALMWIRSRLFLRLNNVWDSSSTSSMKRGPGLSPLESILVSRTLRSLRRRFIPRTESLLSGRTRPLVGSWRFSPSPDACHVGGHTRDNGPLRIPTRSVTCIFVHYCTFVLSYQKGGFTITDIPLELRYPCKISEILCFTKMSIVPVHHLSYLLAPRVINYLSLVRLPVSHLGIT